METYHLSNENDIEKVQVSSSIQIRIVLKQLHGPFTLSLHDHQSNIVAVNFLSSSEPPSPLLASFQLNILVIFLLSLQMNSWLSPELPFFFAV